jgi:VanZ family protein
LAVKTSSGAHWLWWWGPVLAYTAGIFILSSISTLPTLPGAGGDKWAHSIAYSGLALVMLRAVVGGRWRTITWGQAMLAALLTAAYGATDELHQWFVPGRTADVRDLAADAAGALVAVLAAYAIARVRAGRSGR